MDAVVHIGLPKTATTYLQRWLDRNLTALAHALAVVSPGVAAHRIAVQACDPERFHNCPDVRAILERRSWDQVRASVDTLKTSGSPRVVLSSEYFFLTEPTRVRETLEGLGCSLFASSASFGDRIDLSLRATRKKSRILGRSDVQRVGEYNPVYDWNILRETWRQAFPAADFVAHDFDFLRRTATLMDAWKADLGVTEIATQDVLAEKDTVINQSLSAEMVEVCRLANQLGIPSVAALALRAQHAGVGSTPFRLPAPIVETLKLGYSPANERFACSTANAAEFSDFMARAGSSTPGITSPSACPRRSGSACWISPFVGLMPPALACDDLLSRHGYGALLLERDDRRTRSARSDHRPGRSGARRQW